MALSQGVRAILEWAAAVLIAAAVVAALLIGAGKAPRPGPVGAQPAPASTIALLADADPLDPSRIDQVHVADVTVDAAGAASLTRCADESVAPRVRAALDELRGLPALTLSVEEPRADGLALTETQVAKTDPRYVWAVARHLKLKTGLSTSVAADRR